MTAALTNPGPIRSNHFLPHHANIHYTQRKRDDDGGGGGDGDDDDNDCHPSRRCIRSRRVSGVRNKTNLDLNSTAEQRIVGRWSPTGLQIRQPDLEPDSDVTSHRRYECESFSSGYQLYECVLIHLFNFICLAGESAGGPMNQIKAERSPLTIFNLPPLSSHRFLRLALPMCVELWLSDCWGLCQIDTFEAFSDPFRSEDLCGFISIALILQVYGNGLLYPLPKPSHYPRELLRSHRSFGRSTNSRHK
ncbi:hypothetical protein F2P81_000353 [Scophthalmus maximus]|uniref:Uncharacterized protein n=1 Tax=Scophthalmus maximus TaxID=52904 RepID=A0A6A4TSZ4_SCOMX|nr:hypothetical protein F2P81_000353 [Scophthalmus maximus]